MVEVKYLGNKSSWDQQQLRRIFLKHPDKFQIVKEFTQTKEGILIVAGHKPHHEIQLRLDRLDKVLLIFVCGEELRPKRDINYKHDNMIVWASYSNNSWVEHVPNFNRSLGCYVYDIGHEEVKKHKIDIPTNLWFFSGQETDYRKPCINYLGSLTDGILSATPWFNRGKYDKPEYFELMCNSKLLPCPSGAESVDSFRFFEALEAGNIPVPEIKSRQDPPNFNYWNFFFKQVKLPFPLIPNKLSWSNFDQLREKYKDNLVWLKDANKCWAFWQLHKRELEKDLLGHWDYKLSEFTTIVGTSSVPSNPSTEMIEKTVESIRERTDSEILISIDEIRPELKAIEGREYNYQLFIRRLLWLCNNKWKNVFPILHNKWLHQAFAVKEALDYVDTDQVLFVEHDCPLLGDIPFKELNKVVASDEVDSVRFHYDYRIHPEHEYLMRGKRNVLGVPLIKTVQWSQRPHLTKTQWYKDILTNYFNPECRTLIEDWFYGKVANGGDDKFKIFIYAPEGDMRRSGHTDGRAGEDKYGMKYK